MALLDDLGKPDPWRNFATQWSLVFDALELLSFEDYPRAMWMVLNRIVHDLRQQVGEIPDVSNWSVELGGYEQARFGVLAGVLQDFESRFGFLKNDTALLHYLDPEEAHDLINALTIAVGRTKAPPPRVIEAQHVEPIDPVHVEVAWANDEKMRDFYFRAQQDDAYPRAFSWRALLFPLPFALYHRLYGVATVVFLASAGNALVQILKRRGYGEEFAGFSITIYLVLAFAIAFNWRRIRVHALARAVTKFTDSSPDPAKAQQRLARWGRPNRIGMLCGVAVLVLVSATRILFR
jgi:hypothetical protein